MARAGQVVVETLELLRDHVQPGATTAELDVVAEDFIRSHGGVPTFKGYRGFPGSICASPNSMVVHGIPGPYRLEEGDIVSIDVGVTLNGFVGDSAFTFPVGEIEPETQRLLDVCQAALAAGIEEARAEQPHRRHRGRRAADDRGSRLLGGALARGPRRRSIDARGAAGPELRRARTRAEAGVRHDARDRADDHRRRPRSLDRRRPLVDLDGGRLAVGALRAHRRDHGRRSRRILTQARAGSLLR